MPKHWPSAGFQSLLSWKSVSGYVLVLTTPPTALERGLFQSLLSWKSVSGFNGDVGRSPKPALVSILVVMEVGQRLDRSSTPGGGLVQVSILVVMEVGQRLAPPIDATCHRYGEVSILVVMEVGQRLAARDAGRRALHCRVSILVVMDLGQRHSRHRS